MQAPLVWGLFCQAVFRAAHHRFLCSTWSPVSSSRPAVLQKPTRAGAVKVGRRPTLRRTPPLLGHTLTASSTTVPAWCGGGPRRPAWHSFGRNLADPEG